MARLFTGCLFLFLVAVYKNDATSGLRWKRGATARRCDDACKRSMGICPQSNMLPMMMGCSEMCERDSECPPGMKCCDSGCGKMCLPPLGWLNCKHFTALGIKIP